MKKLLLIILMACTYNIKAQSVIDTLPHKYSAVFYEDIKTEQGKNAATLYNAAKLWIRDKSDANKKVLIDDAYQGQLIINASFKTYAADQNGNPYQDKQYTFKIQIDCKDNKYRIQISDIYYKELGSISPDMLLDWDYRSASRAEQIGANHLDGKFKDLMSSLQLKMNNIGSSDF